MKKIYFNYVNFDNEYHDIEKLFQSSGNNFGNCVFHYAVRKLFISDKHEFTQFIDDNTIILRSEANLINTGVSDYIEYLINFCKHSNEIILISVGHQKELYEEFPDYGDRIKLLMKNISEKSKYICTRGKYTTNIIHGFGINNVISVGCPSLMISPNPNLGKTIMDKFNNTNNIRYVFGIHNIMSKYSKKIIQLCKMTNGKIILQDDIRLLHVANGRYNCNPKKYMNLGKIYRSNYTDTFDSFHDFLKFISDNCVYFNIVPKWLDYLHNFDIYIGLKIHGSITALMAGIMSICIVHDNRLLELVEECEIPYMYADDFYNKSLDDIIEYAKSCDLLKFDKKRIEMANTYVRVLKEHDIQPSQHLLDLSNYKDQ